MGLSEKARDRVATPAAAWIKAGQSRNGPAAIKLPTNKIGSDPVGVVTGTDAASTGCVFRIPGGAAQGVFDLRDLSMTMPAGRDLLAAGSPPSDDQA